MVYRGTSASRMNKMSSVNLNRSFLTLQKVYRENTVTINCNTVVNDPCNSAAPDTKDYLKKQTLSGWEENMRKLIPHLMQQHHQTQRKGYSEKNGGSAILKT